MSGELTEQVVDQMMRELIEKGVKPYTIYESVGRVCADVCATDAEVEGAVQLTQSNDCLVLDANPWVSRPQDDEGSQRVWVHVWLLMGDV